MSSPSVNMLIDKKQLLCLTFHGILLGEDTYGREFRVEFEAKEAVSKVAKTIAYAPSFE